MVLKLHESQAKVALDPHRFRVLCNGRRWGKTTLAIDQMKGCAAQGNKRIAYIAPTIQQARDIAWAQLKKDCKDAAEQIWESPQLQILLVNGSQIILRGWEAIETLRGQAFDLVVLDEVAMMKDFWRQWQEVIRPTLTDRKGEGLFISTPKGFNHFYDLYNLQEEDADFKSFHFTTYDNPHIPTEEIEKAKQELPPDRFAQEYMADFKKTHGLVYPEFEREKHVYTEIPDGTGVVEMIAGIDFGFTNPCAVPDIKVDKSDTWWISSEYYETGRTDTQVAEYVAAKNYNAVYPDPEAPGAIAEMRKRGVNVRDVVKGHDSIENGISALRERLRAGKLRVHKSCVNTIMEFETYAYPDKKPDKNEYEVPIDENNHMMDAIRYCAFMRSKRNAQASVHYPTNTMPRNNLSPGPVAGAPPTQPSQQRYAHVHIPRL